MRKILVGGLMAIVLAVSLTPTSAGAADDQHYQLVMWKANGTGISFTYQGPMGIGHDGLPCADLMYPHAKDPSWTGADSAAPILAYIKAYGKTSDVKRIMNPTVFDPTIFQALAAQGVNLADLGGPNVPPGSTPPANLVGKAVVQMPAASANIVGLGIPKPDLSKIQTTSTPPAVSNPTPTPAPPQSKQPDQTSQTPIPNPSIPSETKQSDSTATTEPTKSTQAVIPPEKEVESTDREIPPEVVPPDLVKETENQSSEDQTQLPLPWKVWLYAGIAAVVAIGGGTFGYIKWKQRNN